MTFWRVAVPILRWEEVVVECARDEADWLAGENVRLEEGEELDEKRDPEILGPVEPEAKESNG